MSENEIQNPASAGLNRRSVVKGAAWSVPVIAAAIAAPAASASTPSTDLSVAFGGEQVIRIRIAGVVNANVTLANTLTISNIGGLPSTGGETVAVNYPVTLGSGVTLVSDSGLATVSLVPNGFIITLPAIPAGGSEVFRLGLVSLPVGVLGGTETITAALSAADLNLANNNASTDVGITLLGAGDLLG